MKLGIFAGGGERRFFGIPNRIYIAPPEDQEFILQRLSTICPE
jgi:hypothetical protein